MFQRISGWFGGGEPEQEEPMRPTVEDHSSTRLLASEQPTSSTAVIDFKNWRAEEKSGNLEKTEGTRVSWTTNADQICTFQPSRSISTSGPCKRPTLQTMKSCFLGDGTRRVDYVLAYEDDDDNEKSKDSWRKKRGESSTEMDDVRSTGEKKTDKRQVYERNLHKLGLELEHVDGNDKTMVAGFIDKFLQRFPFLDFDAKLKERFKEGEYFTAPFMRAHCNIFLNAEDREHFFPQSERSRMVYELLIRTRYDSVHADKCRIGIERLIDNGTYLAAFPLHEVGIEFARVQGECYLIQELIRGPEAHTLRADEMSDRQLLYNIWARWRTFYKYQPLSLVKRYFGSKVGLYFAWLGYYTKALFPASVIGILCVLYGLSNLSTNIPSNDICGRDGVGKDIIMCPTCDKLCDFWYLNTSCTYSKITYVVDNGATVFFAAMMSIWATLFLEGWKRYHAEVAWKWDLLDIEIEEDTIRPEFQFSIRTMRENPVTKQQEPYMPLTKRVLRLFASTITVVFALLLVLGFTFGIIMYRIILVSVLHTKGQFFKANAVVFTSVTAACINLVFIIIMGYFYYYLAYKLTEWESPRTQTEFENSYTFKVFLFQFVNYYSSLFYIAFVKGKMSGVPGTDETSDREHGRYRISGYRMEDCDPSGCMLELVIQLAIIMCGRQFFNSFIELGYPMLCTWIRRLNMRLPETRSRREDRIREERRQELESQGGAVPRWEHDYALYPVYELYLFDEYLEMVVQFGFVTLFVAAFPLAPLFALINNIMEIRLDAWKFLVTTQKPTPARARDIGIWLPILDGVSKIAVLINALVIAFTSDFVPKMLYVMTSDLGSLTGYVNNSLSYADATRLQPGMQSLSSPFLNKTVPVCRFRDYRKPPCGLFADRECDDEYGFSFQFWHIFAARLAFVLIFEHVVYIVKAFVAYMIPDMPTSIFIRMQRERYLARQAQLQQSVAEMNNQASLQDDEGGHADKQTNNATNGGCASPSQEERRFVQRITDEDRNAVAFQPGSFDDCVSETQSNKLLESSRDHDRRSPTLRLTEIDEGLSATSRDSYHSARSRNENDRDSSS